MNQKVEAKFHKEGSLYLFYVSFPVNTKNSPLEFVGYMSWRGIVKFKTCCQIVKAG